MAVQTTYSYDPTPRVNRKADSSVGVIVSAVNAEASDSLPFGRAVIYGSGRKEGDPVPVLSCEGSLAADIAGLLIESDDLIKDVHWGDNGVMPKAVCALAKVGTYRIVAANGCLLGDPVFVRIAGGAIGEFRSAADGANTIDVSAFATWESDATAGNPAILRIKFN
jgi:hypothetical protein